MNNDVMELIEMLYTQVTEAWGVPLGNEKCIVERDKVLGLLDEIKARIPVEVSEAKRLVAARDEFIGNAKREAEAIRKSAEERARTLIDEQEIVKAARAQAAGLVSEAEAQARQLRHVANEYTDDLLRQTEEAVGGSLEKVRQVRARFRTAMAPKNGEKNAE